MRRRDKTHAFASLIQTFYNLNHHRLKRSIARDMFQSIAANLIILTINTLQVAMIKKDVANARLPSYHGFFALVDTNGGDIKTCIAATPAGSSRQPIHVALARTQCAVFIRFQKMNVTRFVYGFHQASFFPFSIFSSAS
jgi:hypothetical protein